MLLLLFYLILSALAETSFAVLLRADFNEVLSLSSGSPKRYLSKVQQTGRTATGALSVMQLCGVAISII